MTQFKVKIKVFIWYLSMIPLFIISFLMGLVNIFLHIVKVILDVWEDWVFRYECNMKSCPKGSFMNDPRLKTISEFIKESWSGEYTSNFKRYQDYQRISKSKTE